MSEVERVNMSEQELFDHLVEQFIKQLDLSSDITEVKKANKFNKKDNPKGIPLAELSLIVAAAKLEAKNTFEEFQGKNAEVVAKFKELSGYDN